MTATAKEPSHKATVTKPTDRSTRRRTHEDGYDVAVPHD